MRKIVFGTVLSLAMASLVAGPVSADTWTWRDKGRNRGPLSIASVKIAHDQGYGGDVTLTIAFDEPLDPERMGRDDFVVVDIQSDARGKSEFWVYFVAHRGRLRSFIYYPKSREVSSDGAYFRRPTHRSIKMLSLDHYEQTGGGGLAFAVGAYSETGPGCSGGCWDVTPNRGYLIHDYRRPDLYYFSAPEGFWLEPQVPVRWRARDQGLSGLREARLETSQAGSGRWRTVATRPAGAQRVSVATVEGAQMMFRLSARDGAANVTRSDLAITRIPYDQASETGPGSFTGAWLEQEDPDNLGGTVHTSTAPLDSLSFPGKGNLYCVHLGWGPNEAARVRLQAGEEFADFEHGVVEDGYELPYCLTTTEVEERTATLTVFAGRVSVDWYWSGIDENLIRNGRLRKQHTGPTAVPGRSPSLRALRRGERHLPHLRPMLHPLAGRR